MAQGQISELAVRIKEIQAKAEASEALVQEICRDIKKLDYAKKHLTNAITALRRLAMLTAAVAGGLICIHACVWALRSYASAPWALRLDRHQHADLCSKAYPSCISKRSRAANSAARHGTCGSPCTR